MRYSSGMSKITRSEDEWRERLDAEQFTVCRRGGTEAPFQGRYWDCKEAGTYLCTCCGQALFDSTHKFDSGSGWPRFTRPVTDDCIAERHDTSHGMIRTEVLCTRCDAHLGHVFPDGPPPGGLRYCINSISLQLEPRNA